MLEMKHVSKTYKPKKGVPVKALDDVSVSFGDRGLVFILGKSGSGKSTLLNLVGGLDKADAGEFVIKGKSSKEFKTGDFDSYRNTFVGFIFQEYNILNEFNVGQNIALAMELQGKKATSENLNKILDEVDLTGYAGRKPNELSGGQKQRVAIARALIKDPEIIMADEPTGALDSNTGKQVFDTLKKLSQKKLVLVVSHDREFAEYYGDRVIELADGKIVSDIVKYAAPVEEKSAGVKVVDGDILHIESGYELTEKDLTFINAYLKERKGETIISSDARANNGLKRAAMMDETGAKESFKDTVGTSDAELGIKDYDAADTKFVKSRMPYGKAFKIGASSLKTKPVRLFFTILLSFIALAMFGLADTLAAYDKVTNTTITIDAKNMQSITFQKSPFYSGGFDRITDDERDAFNAETGMAFKGVFYPMQMQNSFTKPNLLSSPSSNEREYYLSYLQGMLDLSAEDLRAYGLSVDGALPSNDNEVAISRYVYECYKVSGYISSDNTVSIKKGEMTPGDDPEKGIIGKTITLTEHEGVYGVCAKDYVITGIVDTHLSADYDVLRPIEEGGMVGGDMLDYMLQNRFRAEMQSGLHNLLFTNEGFSTRAIKNIKESKQYSGFMLDQSKNNIYIANPDAVDMSGFSLQHIIKQSDIPADDIFWLDDKRAGLAADEVVFSTDVMENLVNEYRRNNTSQNGTLINDFSKEYTHYQNYQMQVSIINFENTPQLSYVAASEYVRENEVPQAFLADFRTQIDKRWTNEQPFFTDDKAEFEKAYYCDYLASRYHYDSINKGISGFYDNPYGISGAVLYAKSLYAFITEASALGDVLHKMGYDIVSGYKETQYKPIKVVGFYAIDGKNMGNSYANRLYSAIVADSLYAEKAIEVGYYTALIAPTPNAQKLGELVKLHYKNTDIDEEFYSSSVFHSSLKMSNEVISSFGFVNNLAETLASVFLYVGIGMAVFSALLLSNFIAVSISNKKREIGILRAVGAKSSDVFKIFFNESLLIALINFALGLVATIVTSIYLNRVFAERIGVSVLNFGIRQIGLMLGVSILVAAVASFLPVYFIAKKRPIEAIQGR